MAIVETVANHIWTCPEWHEVRSEAFDLKKKKKHSGGHANYKNAPPRMAPKMADYGPRFAASQVAKRRSQLVDEVGLPLAEVMDSALVGELISMHCPNVRERVFSP